MAKTRIYNDDILIEAVEKYSEQHTSGKIKATKLAEWAQQNIIGLENVRDYHFLREITYKDPKSGQKKRDAVNLQATASFKTLRRANSTWALALAKKTE